MIDCFKYNLTENIQTCLIENWWQVPEVWIGVGTVIIITIIVWVMYGGKS